MRYLMITFLRKPEGRIDESVSIGKKLKTSDQNNSNVILDFAENKVVKCVIESKNHDTTFKQMRDYYEKIYPGLISQLEREASITKKEK
jgi:hypothetical protein